MADNMWHTTFSKVLQYTPTFTITIDHRFVIDLDSSGTPTGWQISDIWKLGGEDRARKKGASSDVAVRQNTPSVGLEDMGKKVRNFKVITQKNTKLWWQNATNRSKLGWQNAPSRSKM
ncbi:hypothetical protein CEXT_652931 [Caerostris extrusa]|uniref:Uncharacterized protein n=1 Tax=Caerostris extrusa TaxID=172846 RepID=A0AAV4XPT4_CAEEX|nr:hypothetical protein CEXT_652931 [Caerostris extrusa]